MADASSPSHISTASAPPHDPDHEDACSAHAQQCAAAAPTGSPSAATANLPLRPSGAFLGSPASKVHDITEKFGRACSALQVGQLVKDGQFTLFESIGAIEIMDPKMDSGFLEPGETLEDDYDTLRPLLPEEVIGVMDQLLCHEMAWHTGYPLSQTLFTSVHIDRLLWPEAKTLKQAQFYRSEIADSKKPGPLLQVLRAYCLAVIKGCDFVIARITSRDYFEEEDFFTHTYNRMLFMKTPMDVFLEELDAAMEALENDHLNMEEALKMALVSRLEFRKFFLRALDIHLSTDQIAYSWPPVIDYLQTLKTSHELGKPVPGACSSKLQRQLASTVPPRPIVNLCFNDAITQLQNLVSDCAEATRFTDLPHDPLEYQSFLWYFASRSPEPLAYARSYLATLLFHEDVLQSSISLPLADMKSLVLPASPLLDPTNWAMSPPRNRSLPKPQRLQFAMLIDEFIERSGQAYLDLWVCLGQNRCRLRRMLTHVIVGWDILQGEASLVDTDIAHAAEQLGIQDEIMEFGLSTWAYTKKLWMIEQVVVMGFEQDVYLPDEFGAMYLFLSLIATRRKELLQRAASHHHTRRRHKHLSAIHRDELDDTEPHLASLTAQADANASLALALAHFYTILLYLHILPHPNRPFSSPALRYELRMKPFLSLQPPEAPPFGDFAIHAYPYGDVEAPHPSLQEHVRDPNGMLWGEVEIQLKRAREAFAEVKRLGAQAARAQGVSAAWGRGVQGGLASCVALGVGVAGVKSVVCGGEGGTEWEGEGGLASSLRVEIPEAGAGKRYAEGWVVVKVVKGKR